MQADFQSPVPQTQGLERLLRLRSAQGISGLLSETLVDPLNDFFSRPSKNVRGKLLEIGFCLGSAGRISSLTSAERELCRNLSEILEAIHAGSLIVDDIQDGSRLRRGQETLHLRYGMPVALNAGNFLYFLPLQRLSELGLEPGLELAA
jgi:geranylgeranyl pyrophosphate synthase